MAFLLEHWVAVQAYFILDHEVRSVSRLFVGWHLLLGQVIDYIGKTSIYYKRFES